jgi:hypothetical protein
MLDSAWLSRIEDMQSLYSLNERQLVSVARLLCTGLARSAWKTTVQLPFPGVELLVPYLANHLIEN